MGNPVAEYNVFNVQDRFQELSYEEVREIQLERSIPANVAIYNDVNDFNLATVIRSAAIFGFQNVFLIGNRKYDRRGTVGAHHYVDITCVPTLKDLWYLHLVALECLEHVPFNFRPEICQEVGDYGFQPGDCLVMGLETSGVPLPDVKYCNGLAYIRQLGVMRSLNAGVAAGIAMHAMTQRIKPVQSETNHG